MQWDISWRRCSQLLLLVSSNSDGHHIMKVLQMAQAWKSTLRCDRWTSRAKQLYGKPITYKGDIGACKQASGRSPNSESLQLQKSGIELF
jgi:hypothetical protein